MNFKFGDKVKQVFASKTNPRRTAIFVRNCGLYIEVTDGNGIFWKTLRISTVPESMTDCDADRLADELWLEEPKNMADPELVAEVAARLSKQA